MCGINGLVGTGADEPLPDALVAMHRATYHRGPDGQGLARPGNAWFAHNLLAVRSTPDQSQQPYQTPNGCLAFNGEIYDFGRVVSAGLDTNILGDRLNRYGPKAVNVLDGMYALAWYDKRTDQTLLARDRNGAKPLYYAETERGLIFSSEYRGMFASGVRKVLDPIGLRLYLQFGYIPGPRTLIAGVRKLYPGECRLYDAAGKLLRSWHTHTAVEPTEFSPKTYRKMLVKAVERTLPSVRPAGLFLSGGMDSASVLWAMNLLGRLPQTLSMRFAGAGSKQVLLDGDCDAAWTLAQWCGTRHAEVRFTEDDYMANLTEAFSCDEPISRKGMPAYLFANREAKALGWTVCYTGDGGDELLSGYGRHVRLLDDAYEESKRTEPYSTWVHLQSHDVAKEAWFNEEARVFDPTEYMKSWVPPVLVDKDRLRTELRLECITHLAEDFLLRADKLGMSQGLETRFPLLSEPFRSYALGLPSNIKTQGRTLKWCAREAMRGHLPDEIVDKPKSGWGPPTGNWLAGKDQLIGPLGDRIKATLVPGRVPGVDRLIDVAKVKGRIKVALAMFYLLTWAEQVGLEDQ